MKERIWFGRIASEIVPRLLHFAIGVSLHNERAITVLEEAYSTSRVLAANFLLILASQSCQEVRTVEKVLEQSTACC